MRALVVREPGRYAVEDIPEPTLGPGEVLVEVAATGICGSDLELLLVGARPGRAAHGRGAGATRAAWRWVVELYAGGILDPAPLVTHRFGLDEAPLALAPLAAPGGDAVKVLVRPGR